jgi:hypothetical protein
MNEIKCKYLSRGCDRFFPCSKCKADIDKEFKKQQEAVNKNDKPKGHR